MSIRPKAIPDKCVLFNLISGQLPAMSTAVVGATVLPNFNMAQALCYKLWERGTGYDHLV